MTFPFCATLPAARLHPLLSGFVPGELIVTQSKSWKVDDIIRAPAYSGGFRVWRVVGVFLGGTAQESVIEIETLDRIENTQGRMCVPCELLEAAMGGAFAG